MDPVHQAIAFVPLGLYLLWLGMLHLRPRPVVWSGAMDNAVLATALVGFAIAGPMEMLLPQTSPMSGPFLWILMLMLYALSVTLWNLLARPRLIVFHATPEQVRQILAQVLPRIDGQTAGAGDSYVLPQAVLQFHLEASSPFQTVSLVAIGDRQSVSGWRKLRRELAGEFTKTTAAARGPGISIAVAGAVILGYAMYGLCRLDPVTAAQTLHSILRDTSAAREPIQSGAAAERVA
jgi:hypothetical protein